MKKVFLPLLFSIISIFFSSLHIQAQTREELERQRQQLKKEIEETEKLLKKNKTQEKENLLQWKLINNKVNLQDRVIENLNKDVRLLNNNMYTIQRDITKYDKLLDTLKQEYAKSMVYAYKNRSNYEFLNFIFSASNFNDAIKRISYLKSYRNYREMQGENILRTQQLRHERIDDLTGTKKNKATTLQAQSNEMAALESQQKEKDRILSEIKKQGKTLNNQIAAKQKQVKKVNSAIASAIKRALEEARKEAMAKAAAEDKKRKNDEAIAKANTPASAPVEEKKAAAPVKPVAEKRVSVLLNADNTALNNSFEKNRGSLPWPVDKGYVLMHYGSNKMPSGSTLVVTSVTISSDIGAPVKSVFDGTVVTVTNIEDMQVVIIQHGKYFTTYSNLSSASVNRGQDVRTGQVIGRVAANFDGVGAIDFYMSNESSNFDPERWLRNR
ncbi:MAG: peptidoglycan DD-metalloendopeptidase family protein [Ferruginibacter sp.]